MGYRCEATTLEGFLQQLAVCYVGRGYWFYVTGFVPLEKDPACVDKKLIERYGIDISKWSRARRKRAGAASVQYIRFRRFFVLLATHGNHRFFSEERANIRDVRRAPITFGGYSVSSRSGRPHVRIAKEEFLGIKAFFIELAHRSSTDRIERELAALAFEPYAPIRSQYLSIIRVVNRARSSAGLPTISRFCVRLKRRIYRPFEPVEFDEDDDLTIETG